MLSICTFGCDRFQLRNEYWVNSPARPAVSARKPLESHAIEWAARIPSWVILALDSTSSAERPNEAHESASRRPRSAAKILATMLSMSEYPRRSRGDGTLPDLGITLR